MIYTDVLHQKKPALNMKTGLRHLCNPALSNNNTSSIGTCGNALFASGAD
jgi:hypothetical protein